MYSFLFNPQGYFYYFNYLLKKHIVGTEVVDDPFMIIYVPPKEITTRKNDTIDKWKHMGEVRSGDWDKRTENINESTVYRSLIHRYLHEEEWEETDIYQKSVRKVREGQSYWNGCRSIRDIQKRTEEVDSLYDVIASEGYRSQADVFGKTTKQRLLSPKFRRSMTEVAISIGRNGEYILADGHHRLAISQSLNINKIPVRVVVIHNKYKNKTKFNIE